MADGTSPAPVAPVTPAPAVAPPVPPAPAAEAPKSAAELERLQKAYDLKVKEAIIERRKYASQVKELQTKAQKAAELEKREMLAKRNPPEFLKSIYGDKWYDVLVESKINGVPPADLIASEMDKMREDFNAQLKQRDEQAKAQQAEASKASVEQARRSLRHEAQTYYAANTKDYPLLESLGPAESVAATLAQHIEAEYNRTEKRDESGQLIAPGRVMTAKEAADALEANLLAIAKKAFSAEKYKQVLTPPPPSPNIGGPKLQKSVEQQQPAATQQQRRTLSNDLTGSTPGREPAVSASEKRQRAIAAFNALHKR